MRYSIALPQHVSDGTFDPRALRTFLDRAEELGFEGAWMTEQVLGRMPHLSPLETLSFAAACNARLRLGCAVFVTPLHSPVHLAKNIATLDQLSRGRLEIGVGTGGRNRMFSAFGVNPDDPLVARFNEGIAVMKALWTQPQVSFDGRFWQLDNASMEPKPFQKPYPPLWYGGSAPAALRRAVRHGDGFFGAGSSTTENFAAQVAGVRAALTEFDRDPAEFRIAKRVYIAVDDDADRARDRMAKSLIDIYGPAYGSTLLPTAVAGTPADCAAGLRAVAAAGAEMILLNPLFDAGEQIERLVGEVLPQT